ncbi:MAG: helix-turn-helix transcriptional regulator [Desulfobacterales bacterium]|nr:helix-turn-helix transcriptional regulator [Desulfobacterales bacterium]
MKNQPQEAKSLIEPLNFSEELARAVIDSLSAHIAILDENGVILENNRAWKAYSVKNGMPEDFDFRGMNYLEVCNAATGEDALDAQIILTPQEIKVVTLIKDGKSSKEIGDILNISETTVNFHRKNLRKKFGLKNRQMNLRSYLMSMTGG